MTQHSNMTRTLCWAIALFATLSVATLQRGFAQDQDVCSLATLNGRYAFDATGWNIVNGSAVPKTVVEFLTFKGDSTLTSIATAVVGGNIIANDAPGSGNYTVNSDCTGTLTFNGSGLTFDLFIAPNGKQLHMIETVTGQMLAGVAQRVGS
jgi:hypothetical protein